MPVESIVDFISELKKIPKSSRNEYYFRGHSDKSFELRPSIYRQNFIRNEDKLFKETILRTPNEFINEKTTLEKLVKMQHYGIPTRILDLTTNPLVALYFACTDVPKENGEVLVFRIPKKDVKFYDSDTVSILANIAKRPYSFSINYLDDSSIRTFNSEDEIAYLLHEIKEEKPHFLPIIDPEDLERVVAVKVKLNNTRIVKQHGAFLIFGMNGSKKYPAEIPENWQLNLDIKGIDFTIKNDCKQDILNDLDVLGINESTLFPELQNQATYLKRQFR